MDFFWGGGLEFQALQLAIYDMHTIWGVCGTLMESYVESQPIINLQSLSVSKRLSRRISMIAPLTDLTLRELSQLRDVFLVSHFNVNVIHRIMPTKHMPF